MDAQTVALLITVVATPIAGGLVAKYLRPNATPLEMLAEAQEERAEDRKRLAQVERSFRILQDYVHELRQHIADEKPPPPPPWPEGLNQ